MTYDLLKKNYAEPTVVEGDPVLDTQLLIRKDQKFGLRRPVSFDIACRVEGQEDAPTILRCPVAGNEYEAIRAAYLKYGRSLSPRGRRGA
jgi:hypothetical protein